MTFCYRVNRKAHLSTLDEILSKLDAFGIPIKPENVNSLVNRVHIQLAEEKVKAIKKRHQRINGQ